MSIHQVIETYNHGAAAYEAIMERYWHVDREPLIASLQLSPGQTVLDAAVGTGLNLPAYPEGVRVIGVDLSQGMLDEARKKNVSAEITLQVMNLQNLDFPDDSFDAALQLGFPTGKIKWNALMDYDQLIYNSNLSIEVLLDERIESLNPFLCGCQLLLKNSKN